MTKIKACCFAVATAERAIELYRRKNVLSYFCITIDPTYVHDYDTTTMTIIYRSVPIHGFHDDYAFVVKGLLDLYQANFDVHWLEFAEQLQDIQDRLFWDSQDGGYFSTVEDSQMILRMKDGTF